MYRLFAAITPSITTHCKNRRYSYIRYIFNVHLPPQDARQQREYDEYVKSSMRKGAMRELTTSEKQMILAGLKANWEDIHHQYQGLSVVTDTAPKKNRKERMEGEMDQLEKDIELLEKHGKIYVTNT